MITVLLPDPVLVVRLPLPPACLSINARPNRWEKSRAAKKARADAWRLFKAAMSKAGLSTLGEALVRSTVYSRVKRYRDGDNMPSATKATFDGAQDAGLIADDVTLTHLPPRFRIDRKDPRLVVEVFDASIQFITKETT